MEDQEIGRPVQVVSVNKDHTFTLNEEELRKILDKENVRDKPVVVVSVAGAFRKGKSFLLSYFVRYLQAEGKGSWLGKEDSPLDGLFHWRGGCEADTSGILLWSQAFLVEIPSGETVAVVLMDTQGTFDTKTTLSENATIFALSTLLSSIQVYNISQNIQENDLQHLQLFTEFGKLALESYDDVAPFQKLQFLVRDWISPAEYSFGAEGGAAVLNKRLQMTKDQPAELKNVRHHIRICFSAIECFLMPHPGHEVAENNCFDGCLQKMKPDFREMLHKFIALVLQKDNLEVKAFGGQKIRAKDLLIYFSTYMNLFKEGKIPEVKSMFEATTEANNRSAIASAEDLYHSRIKKEYEGCKSFFKDEKLLALHEQVQREALDHFEAMPKFGGGDLSGPFRSHLQEKLQKHYQEIVKQNNTRKELVKVNIQNAVGVAKNNYRAVMAQPIESQTLLDSSGLQALHLKAKTEVVQRFSSLTNIGDAEFFRPYLNELEKELELMLQEFVDKHVTLRESIEGNYKTAVAEEGVMYRRRMQESLGGPMSEASKLQQLHRSIKDEVLRHFQQLPHLKCTEFTKIYHCILEQDLEKIYPEFEAWLDSQRKNAIAENQAAVKSERDLYRSSMQEFLKSQVFFEESELQQQHEKLELEALKRLKERQCINIGNENFVELLKKDIDEVKGETLDQNKKSRQMAESKNASAITSAKKFLGAKMEEVLQNSDLVISDTEFKSQYEKFKQQAEEVFTQAAIGTKMFQQGFLLQFRTELDQGYQQFLSQNKTQQHLATESNISAMKAAKEQYRSKMSATFTGSNPANQEELLARHRNLKNAAVEKFRHENKLGGKTFSENFINDLEKELEKIYAEFEERNQNKHTASAKESNLSAKSKGKALYVSLMQQLFDNPSSFYEENELREKHLQVKSKCLDQFTNAAIGAEETWRLIASQLEQDLDNSYPDFKSCNRKAGQLAISNVNLLLTRTKEDYHTKMRLLFSGQMKPFLETSELEQAHSVTKKEVIEYLRQQPNVDERDVQKINVELNRVYLDEFVERNKKEQARAIDVQASVALANAKRLFGKQMQDLFADNKESDASELSSRILMLKTQVHDEAQEALAGTSFMPQLNEGLDKIARQYEQIHKKYEGEKIEVIRRSMEQEQKAQEVGQEAHTTKNPLLALTKTVANAVAVTADALDKIFHP